MGIVAARLAHDDFLPCKVVERCKKRRGRPAHHDFLDRFRPRVAEVDNLESFWRYRETRGHNITLAFNQRRKKLVPRSRNEGNSNLERFCLVFLVEPCLEFATHLGCSTPLGSLVYEVDRLAKGYEDPHQA